MVKAFWVKLDDLRDEGTGSALFPTDPRTGISCPAGPSKPELEEKDQLIVVPGYLKHEVSSYQ